MSSQNTSSAQCACGGAPRLIFACSGAADVGHLADLAARRLTKEGLGRMFCLAGVGGRVNNIMATTGAASAILVIDGCQFDCARKTLENAGFQQFVHMRLTDLGFERGKSSPTDELVGKVVEEAKKVFTTGEPASQG